MPIPKSILYKSYVLEQKSMFDIARNMNVSIHKVQYWLTKYKIPRRNQKDANYAKYNPDGDPFNIKSNLSIDDQHLYYLAMGFYWGEGGKTNYQTTRLVNSDPTMILIFYKFLLNICRVKTSKIHFHLQTFKDNDIQVAKNYWAKTLGINAEYIHTSQPIPSQGKGNYKNINIHGVMAIDVYNTHFQKWMMEQLTKLGYNPNIR